VYQGKLGKGWEMIYIIIEFIIQISFFYMLNFYNKLFFLFHYLQHFYVVRIILNFVWIAECFAWYCRLREFSPSILRSFNLDWHNDFLFLVSNQQLYQKVIENSFENPNYQVDCKKSWIVIGIEDSLKDEV